MGENIYTWIILIKNTLNKVFRKKEKHIVKDVIEKLLWVEEIFIISSNNLKKLFKRNYKVAILIVYSTNILNKNYTEFWGYGYEYKNNNF